MARRKGKSARAANTQEVVGNKCDVGGCENEGDTRYGDWKVCSDHFEAYLDDEFDLPAYFYIKRCKELGLAINLNFLEDDILDAIIDVNEEVGD